MATKRKTRTGSHGARTNETRVKQGRPPGDSRAGNGTDGWLGPLRLGDSKTDGALEFAPLLRDGDAGPPGVLLTKQAVEAGLLEIVEQGGGVVQELLARNRGDLPVAILEGDTLVGCKQNRVVAHSVIVAPGASLNVPVGCMEYGRWRHETAIFAVGDVKMSPEVRSRTHKDVQASFQTMGRKQLDQHRLWRDVDDTLAACQTPSLTSDYYEIVKREGRSARERAASVAPAPGQVGVVVLADGALVGVEMVGHQALWSSMAEATLASYFTGRQRGGTAPSDARASAAEWLARLQSARVATSPGVGLGTDLSIEGTGLAGVGLALGALPLHVAVFPA